MSNQLTDLLEAWYPLRDQASWVLGTVYRTQGPAYRKAGAMMLLSDQGHQLGMLSGGCLESDIHRESRRVMLEGQARTLVYDGSDEDDLAYRLGIGCGGCVYILLQPISTENDYLDLDCIRQTLSNRDAGFYYQQVDEHSGIVAARFTPVNDQVSFTERQPRPAQLQQQGNELWLKSCIQAPPHLLIAGGGMDAKPVAAIAHQMGWQVSVWDPRPANGRAEHFPNAQHLLSCPAEQLTDYVDKRNVDGVIVMNHSLDLDAAVLVAMSTKRLSYLALLGPFHRRGQVLAEAGLTDQDLLTPLRGPAGLDLGANLPESIALAIVAECQAAIGQGSCRALDELKRGESALYNDTRKDYPQARNNA